MRVNEKYSTLPAEDRSVHIINICAIEDIGYLPSEGTVRRRRQPRSPGKAAHLRQPGAGGRIGEAPGPRGASASAPSARSSPAAGTRPPTLPRPRPGVPARSRFAPSSSVSPQGPGRDASFPLVPIWGNAWG